ncbi:hypothetical protein [Luteimonas cellulosilyticus]|uniref:hypothetical protein n=1 Tax=Luteimonas cellulosilyticus TaxID=2683586 RepID=UPI0013594AED|nr:hypothetical protein [Luteimonas cellulosilyticus]
MAPVTDAVAAVAPAPVAAPVEATLFDHLAARDASMLLERDGVRVAIDPRAGLLYPPTTDDAPSVLARAGAQPGWQPVAMLSGTFDPAALGLGAGVPLDAFVWRAAIASGPALTRVPAAQRLALRAWPDVDVATLPLPWLLPIACLLQHSWTRQSLARATGLGLEDATRILAAAKCSGLAVIDTRPVAPVAVPRPAEIAAAPARGFLARVARRFGMQFGGSRG